MSFLLSPSPMITDKYVPCQRLHYPRQSGSFPVILLHIELSGATLGATMIDASEIPCSIFSLLPTRVGGGVNSNPVANTAAGNLHHPTSFFSFFCGQSTMGTYSNPASCGSTAFNMDSLKANLETDHLISCVTS
jgi:hypothetical protein